MSIPNGKSEVVRYVGADPVGWVERGTLCRVVQRTNGKVRVARVGNEPKGAPQYLPEDSVELVGSFENSLLFGTGLALDLIGGCPKPDEPGDEPTIGPDDADELERAICAVTDAGTEDATTCASDDRPPEPAPVPEAEGRPDIRGIIRAEIAVAMHERIAEVVRGDRPLLRGRERPVSGATAKGTRFEAMVANYLVMALNSDYVERKAKNGNADQGDIAGVRLPDGSKVAIECKNRAAYSLPEWLAEARTEARNYGAKVGVVVFKRKGVGVRHMGDQFVLMGLDEFARIIKSKE